MLKLKLICTLCLCFIFYFVGITPIIAQDIKQDNSASIDCRGYVFDEEGNPVAGAGVLIQGKDKKGVVTGVDGSFYFSKLKEGTVLDVSFMGFEPTSVVFKGKPLKIILKEDKKQLEQVVVTGYSKIELRKATGAVSVVSGEDIRTSPLKTVDQLLQGKLAGVVVNMTSGRPGATASVRIRGTSSITGDSEPLWVVDGVPLQKDVKFVGDVKSRLRNGDFDDIYRTGIAGINPNDIESITVLKDAAASAIYGSRAAGGVIVITTKKPEQGALRLNYSGGLSVQTKPLRSNELMTSAEKIEWEQELWDEFSKERFNQGRPYPVIGLVGQVYSGYGPYKGLSAEEKQNVLNKAKQNNTDWYGLLFRNSVSQNHYVSLSGGSNVVAFYLSGGVNINNGLVIKNQSKSYTFTSKLDFKYKDMASFGLAADINYLTSLSPNLSVDPFRYAYFANPYEKPYDNNGNYTPDQTWFSLKEQNKGTLLIPLTNQYGFNIMREINETTNQTNAFTSSVRANANVTINKNLNFSSIASCSFSYGDNASVIGEKTQIAWNDRPFDGPFSKRIYGSITESTSKNFSYLLRGQLNYSKSLFSKHFISAIAGSEIRSSIADSHFNKRYGYDPVVNDHHTPKPDTSIDDVAELMDGYMGHGKSENAFASFYSSVSYSYRNKYVASFTVRSDGSNNFGAKSQFNANWSVSGAWNIDEEQWFKNRVLTSLSLRVGTGYTGGVNKSAYPVIIMRIGSKFRDNGVEKERTGSVDNPANPNLRWEKTQTINSGLSFALFDRRISGEVSCYHNISSDLVTEVKNLSTSGYPTNTYNTSEMTNSGVEVSLSSLVFKTNDLALNVSANFAYNFNKLTKFDSPNSIYNDNYVGYPMGKLFAGITTGINSKTGMYDYRLRPDAVIKTMEDYKKTNNYLFYFGTKEAPYNGGFSASLSYKRFSVSLFGSYSVGKWVFDKIVSEKGYLDVSYDGAVRNNNIPLSVYDVYSHHLNNKRDVRNRWTESSPITNGYPRLIDAYGDKIVGPKGEDLTYRLPSGRTEVTDSPFLQNVSFLKLGSLSVSYSLSDKLAKKLYTRGINLSLAMNNLFFITKYKGVDPELPGATYPQARSISFNVSVSL